MKKLNKIFSRYFPQLRRITPIMAFLLLIVSAGTVFTIKYFGRQPLWRTVRIQVVGKDWIDNFTNYNGYRPPFWLTDKIKVGDSEIAIDGRKVAEVMTIDEYERIGPESDLYLTVKLYGEVSTRLKKFLYRGRPIEVGAPIELHLNRVAVIGQTIDDSVPENGYPKKNITITARLQNTEPWIINGLSIGDTMVNRGDKLPIATIRSFHVEPPISSILFVPPNGSTNLFLENNPRLKDLIINATLSVQNQNGDWYFAGHQKIKVGNGLWLYLSRVNLNPLEIQSVEDAQ